jgi:hypothetical protein
VLAWERVVVQRLLDPGQHQRRGIRQLHLFQFRGDLFRFLLFPIVQEWPAVQ